VGATAPGGGGGGERNNSGLTCGEINEREGGEGLSAEGKRKLIPRCSVIRGQKKKERADRGKKRG